jgi:methyltransferase-like protein/SAM-dependent methyltransferase
MPDNPPLCSYDEVPYPSYAYAQTHPDRLGTLATLFGMSPAPVEHCRVLEIGCASGGNLLPMAEGLPGSEFLGIDLSARHIEMALEARAAVGLTNVRLLRMSVEDVTEELGRFDYVIAHGVYSWVPPPVRDALLAACRNLLAPHGVAYISYNTLPGWRDRDAIRDMMRFHTRNLRQPEARAAQGRALLDFLAEHAPAEQGSYTEMLRSHRQVLTAKADGYLLHDELSEINDPVYFHEFLSHATQHGLQFLAEAEAGPMLAPRLPPGVTATVAKLGNDLVAREQYLDFLTNRTFRRTLLCRQEVSLRRDLKPQAVTAFLLASPAECLSAKPDVLSRKPEEFRGPTGVTVGTDHPLSKAAFLHLASVWPASLSFEDLQVAVRARLGGGVIQVQSPTTHSRDTELLAENLLQAFTADVVVLHVAPPRLATAPGERPRTSAYARFQAGLGDRVTTLRHEVLPVDEVTRHLLCALDGSRDRTALLEGLVRLVDERGLVVQQHGRPVTEAGRRREVLAEGLETNLRLLARSALLVE